MITAMIAATIAKQVSEPTIFAGWSPRRVFVACSCRACARFDLPLLRAMLYSLQIAEDHTQ